MARKEPIRKVNKKAYKQLDELLLSNSFVKAGILAKPEEKSASKSTDSKKVRAKGGIKSSGVNLVTIAAIHEFGSEEQNIPQRSFLRSTFRKEKRKIGPIYKKLSQKAIKSKTYDPKKILDQLGVWFVGRVKNTFTSNNWDALKDPTRGGRNKSGQATPLIDTNQLRGSIAHRTIEGKKGSKSSLAKGAINES